MSLAFILFFFYVGCLQIDGSFLVVAKTINKLHLNTSPPTVRTKELEFPFIVLSTTNIVIYYSVVQYIYRFELTEIVFIQRC